MVVKLGQVLYARAAGAGIHLDPMSMFWSLKLATVVARIHLLPNLLFGALMTDSLHSLHGIPGQTADMLPPPDRENTSPPYFQLRAVETMLLQQPRRLW